MEGGRPCARPGSLTTLANAFSGDQGGCIGGKIGDLDGALQPLCNVYILIAKSYHLGVLLHGARTVRHLSDVLEILSSEEAHRKPLLRVFPNACGWSPKAFG